MIPELEEKLTEKGIINAPYVNVFNKDPKNGFTQFFDSPRYSTGYTSLFNTLSLTVETHMLKPYKDRVLGTRAIMEEMIAIGSENLLEIKKARTDSFKTFKNASQYVLNYELDNSKADTLNFLGYKAVIHKNELTGNDLMRYDRDQPFNKKTIFRNYFKATDSVLVPDYYILPQSQWKIIELMRFDM
jgi:hypothetical protein